MIRRVTSFWFLSLSFLLFFRSGIALRISGIFDERCYFSWLEFLLNINTKGCESSSHPLGIALLWFPFAFLGKGLAHFFHEDPESWMIAFTGLSGFVFWGLSLSALARICDKIANETQDPLFKKWLQSDWIPPLLILQIPALFYAGSRSLMVHSGELFLALLLLWAILSANYWLSFFCFALLLVTRPIDFIFFLPLTIGFSKRILPLTLLCSIAFLYLIKVAFISGYHDTYLLPLLKNFTWRQVGSFLFRSDFGVVWTQPIWVLFIAHFLRRYRSLSSFCWSLGFCSLFAGLVTLLWPTHGSTFSFRYLIGTYPCLLVYFLLDAPNWSLTPFKLKALTGLMYFQSLWLQILLWVYRGPQSLWPWASLQFDGWAPPYSVISSWFSHFDTFIKMGNFSALGQLISAFQGTHLQFDWMGEGRNYALDGLLGKGVFFLSLFACGVWLVTSFILVLNIKRRMNVSHQRF
jgi:hypothetical protein